MEYLSVEDVCHINARLIQATGGRRQPPDNLLSRGLLEYILDAIRGSVFGVDRYPGLSAKAAAVCWTIATGHPFYDTNKRTAAESAFALIEMNGMEIRVSSEELIATMLKVAGGQMDQGELRYWLEEHIRPATGPVISGGA